MNHAYTDSLQTIAIVVLSLTVLVVIYHLRKTMDRAAKLKATVIRHNRLLKGKNR